MGLQPVISPTSAPTSTSTSQGGGYVDPYAQYRTASPSGQPVYVFPDQASYTAAINGGLPRQYAYWQKGPLLVGSAGDQKPGDPNDPMYLAEKAAFAASKPTYTFTDANGVTQTRATSNPGGDSIGEVLTDAAKSVYHDPSKLLDVNGKETESVTHFPDGSTGDGTGGQTGGGSMSGPGGNTGAAQAAMDFANQLKAERDAAAAAGPRPVSQVTAGTATAGQVDPSAVAKKGGTAATYTPGSITATPSTLYQSGPAGQMTAGSAGAGSVSAGAIDTTQNQIGLDTDSRRQQQQAIDLAASAARGEAPSAAQELMKESVDRGAAAQLGAAASLQGRNPGQALRAGIAGASDVFAKSAAATGALRATEMAEARRDFLSGAGQERATDVDVQKANQSTVLQANMANLSADTQSKIASLQAQTQAAVATLQAQTAAGQSNLAAQTQVQLANLQAATQKAHDDAANELAAKIASGNISLESFKATLAANTTLSAADIDAQVRLLMTNANNTTSTNIANTGFQLDASKANASNQLVSRQVDDALALGKGQQLIAALGLPADADKARILAAAAAHAGDQAWWGQILTATGTVLAASDMTLKENISDGAQAADDFLSSLRPKTFGYKDPAYGPDYVLGVLAQDLPKRTVTRNPKDGKLWIDANVISEVLAGLGRVNQRLKKVENPRG